MAAENQTLTKFRKVELTRATLRKALAKMSRDEIARRQRAIRARRVRAAQRHECDELVAAR